MGERRKLNFEERFKGGFRVVYPKEPSKGVVRIAQNQRILDAVKTVLTEILKREPTPDELYGCKPIVQNKKPQAGRKRN